MCLLQFFYDRSGVGAPLRNKLVVQLGTWHTYKQACTVVWRWWGPRVFAPLFHELISHANFSMSAKLSSITRFLTIVRLAYPSFKQDLDDAISGRSGLPDDERVAMSQLRDLKKLLNFFIPVVSGQFAVGLPDAPVTRHILNLRLLVMLRMSRISRLGSGLCGCSEDGRCHPHHRASTPCVGNILDSGQPPDP